MLNKIVTQLHAHHMIRYIIRFKIYLLETCQKLSKLFSTGNPSMNVSCCYIVLMLQNKKVEIHYKFQLQHMVNITNDSECWTISYIKCKSLTLNLLCKLSSLICQKYAYDGHSRIITNSLYPNAISNYGTK